MKILLVEDDQKTASFIMRGIREAGYSVDLALDGNQGLEMALSHLHGVIILDLMLPGRDGFEIISELEKANISTPLLVLSARHSVDDRLRALRGGSDDYLVKPFVLAELIVRVEALVRRASRTYSANASCVGDLVLDPVERKLTRNGKLIELQPREYALMALFMTHPGQLITRSIILDKVWGYGFDPQTNIVDVIISRLRGKVDKGHQNKLIHTIRGSGYILEVRD